MEETKTIVVDMDMVTMVREVGQRFGAVATVTVDGRAYEGEVVPYGFRLAAINSARVAAGLPALEMEHPLASTRRMEAEMEAERARTTAASLPSRRR